VADLQYYALQRQTAQLAQRLELLEQILDRAGLIDAVLGQLGPNVDPAPIDVGRFTGVGARIAAGGMSDPPPDDLGRGTLPVPGRAVTTDQLVEILRHFKHGDPAPTDISRFSKAQLDSALHDIAAERARLDSLEGMVKDQIQQVGQG
jgi:hypothetical protein